MDIAVVAMCALIFCVFGWAFTQRRRLMQQAGEVVQSLVDALRESKPAPSTFNVSDVFNMAAGAALRDANGELTKLRYTPKSHEKSTHSDVDDSVIYTTTIPVWCLDSVLAQLSERAINWERVGADAWSGLHPETLSNLVLRMWLGDAKEQSVYILIGEFTYYTRSESCHWTGRFGEEDLQKLCTFDVCTLLYPTEMFQSNAHPIKVLDLEEIFAAVEMDVVVVSQQPKTKIYNLDLSGYPLLRPSFNFAANFWSSDEKDKDFAGNFLGQLEFVQENLRRTWSGGQAFNIILQFLSATTREGKWNPTSFFFGGETGTGKTTLVSTLIKWLNYHMDVTVVLCQHTFFKYFDSPEGQAKLQQAFARHKNIVLVFDDFDKLADAREILMKLAQLLDNPTVLSAFPAIKCVLVSSNKDPLKVDASIVRNKRFLYVKVDGLDPASARKVAHNFEAILTAEGEWFDWQKFEEELAVFGKMSISSIIKYIVKPGNLSLSSFDEDEEEEEDDTTVERPSEHKNRRRNKKKKKNKGAA